MGLEILRFDSDGDLLEAEEDTGGEWPLEITITGEHEANIQSYCLNENEIVVLFNLLYRILKRDYEGKLEALRQSATHAGLTDI